jgi:Glycerophosphoryl diester phosphodiesterase
MGGLVKGKSFWRSLSWTWKNDCVPEWVVAIPVAHRGLFDHTNNIPENSLFAFKRAITQGYAIELDVHLSKDNEVMVHHDINLSRLSQDSRRLQDLSLLELQAIKLLNSDQYIPSLKEVLQLVGGQVPLYIEIKHHEEEEERRHNTYVLEQGVLELLKTYQGPVAILSFDPQSLYYIRKNAPHILRGQNFCPKADHQGRRHLILKNIIKNLCISRAHFIVYDYLQVPRFLAKGLSYWRAMIAYTVNSLEHYSLVKTIAHNVIFENFDLNILNNPNN